MFRLRFKRRRLRRRGLAVIAGLALFMVMLAARAHHDFDERGRCGIAEDITRALMARNIAAAAPLFAAGVRETIVDDARLGAFADQLDALGQLRELRELPSNGLARSREYLATFTNGQEREELTFEGDKVIGFSLVPG